MDEDLLHRLQGGGLRGKVSECSREMQASEAGVRF